MGIHPSMCVVFGSFARGNAGKSSDIDLLVVAPELEPPRSIARVKKLWRAASMSDNRIEPNPCGVKEWQTGDDRPLLEIVKKEGVIISK